MEFTIVVTRRAEADIDSAVRWMARHRSATIAARWHLGIRQAIRSLRNEPARCPVADEAVGVGIELRELIHQRRRTVYRVLFTVGETEVTILRVRNAAQDRLTDADI